MEMGTGTGDTDHTVRGPFADRLVVKDCGKRDEEPGQSREEKPFRRCRKTKRISLRSKAYVVLGEPPPVLDLDSDLAGIRTLHSM